MRLLLAATVIVFGCLAAYGDAAAEAAWAKTAKKLEAARSLTMAFDIERSGGTQVHGTIDGLQPGYLKCKFSIEPLGSMLIISNGKTIWLWCPDLNRYDVIASGADAFGVTRGFVEGFVLESGKHYRLGALKRAMFDGKSCLAIPYVPSPGSKLNETIYLDAKTGLPVANESVGADGTKTVVHYRDVRMGVALSPKDFAWKPPVGARKGLPSGLVFTATPTFALYHPSADGIAKAKQVWDKLTAKMKQAWSFSMPWKMWGLPEMRSVAFSGEFSFLLPHSLRLVSDVFGLYCDGKTETFWSPLTKGFETHPFDAATDAMLAGFEALDPDDTPPKLGALLEGTFSGQRCYAMPRSWEDNAEREDTLYVSIETGLPIGYESGDKKTVAAYGPIRFNVPLKAKDFEWKPPAGAKKSDTTDKSH